MNHLNILKNEASEGQNTHRVVKIIQIDAILRTLCTSRWQIPFEMTKGAPVNLWSDQMQAWMGPLSNLSTYPWAGQTAFYYPIRCMICIKLIIFSKDVLHSLHQVGCKQGKLFSWIYRREVARSAIMKSTDDSIFLVNKNRNIDFISLDITFSNLFL